MKRWELLDQAPQPDGSLYTLHRHDGIYVIRVNGGDLMSTRQHASEDRLAELICGKLVSRPHPCVLVGGLGFGFTARKALKVFGPKAKVVIAEISEAIVQWNRNAEYALAKDVLEDPRVELVMSDVAQILRTQRDAFDGIMLDVDNGPEAFSTAANKSLYQMQGLAEALCALKKGGCVGYWSAHEDPAFEKLMAKAGFRVEAHRARAHVTSGGFHTIFVGRVV